MKSAVKDKLQQYRECLKALHAEKARLEARLEQINAALAEGSAVSSAPSRRVPRQNRTRRNGLSLRAAVLQVTRNRPLSKPEILDAVGRIGYKFSTKDPMNSLNAMLYAPANRFRNQNGRFAPK